MGKPSSKRVQYERLSNPDEQTLEAFAELDRQTQMEIIRTILRPAGNPKVAKAERELADRRASVYEEYLNPGKSD